MSAPAAPAPDQQQPTDEQALLGALAVVLLSGQDARVQAAHALPLLAALGVAPAEGMAVLALLLPHPLVPATTAPAPAAAQAPGPAQVWNNGTALTRRVEYLVAAAKRLAKPQHSPARERVYLAAHLRAQQDRAKAAVAVDQAARRHGSTLGWYATLDRVTTPECRAAHGANFSASRPPVIGWPGTLHGGTCRCIAGKPHKTTLTVDEAIAPLTENAVIPFVSNFTRPDIRSDAHSWK